MKGDERTRRDEYGGERDESMDSRVADVGLLSVALSADSTTSATFIHASLELPRNSLPAPCCQQPRPYPQAAALVTGARVAERRRKHEPTSPQLITRKTSSLRHVTKHTGIVSATCETSTDLEEAREKDKVVRSVRRTDSLARIQPQREMPACEASRVVRPRNSTRPFNSRGIKA